MDRLIKRKKKKLFPKRSTSFFLICIMGNIVFTVWGKAVVLKSILLTCGGWLKIPMCNLGLTHLILIRFLV